MTGRGRGKLGAVSSSCSLVQLPMYLLFLAMYLLFSPMSLVFLPMYLVFSPTYLLFSPMYLLFSTTREQVVKLFCHAGRNLSQLRLISNNSEAGVWANQLNDLMYFSIFCVCKTTL